MQKRTIQILSIALLITLLGWGIYTLLVYLGVPVHGSVLLSNEAKAAVEAACPDGGMLCRGIHSFFPAIGYTLSRANPLVWYTIVSLIIYALYVGWNYLQRGKAEVRFALTPWKLLLGFVVSLWLLLIFLSSGSGPENNPMRRLYEPLPQVYVGASEEGLLRLQENFQDLQDSGCLRYIGQTNHNAGVYDYRGICVQKAFVTRVLTQLFFVLIFIFEILILGRLLLTLMRVRPRSDLMELLIATGLGVCGWIAILWTIAVVSFATVPFYISSVGWILFLVIPLIGFRHARYWIEKFLRAHISIHQPWHSVTILLAWLVISYLAFNFLSVVRPFPIGWDDLGSYLNRPRLLVSYGHFISPVSRFGWEYLTSLGYLLFGFDSSFGATYAMMINWVQGLFAVAAVWIFVHTFLGKGRGLLAAAAYYTLPLVGHFSFADMKIDNAVFFMGTLATFCLFVALFPVADEEEIAMEELTVSHRPRFLRWLPHHWQWYLLAGLFAGFAFAMKSTAIMVVLALGAILLGALLHWSAFIGGVAFVFLILAQRGVFNVPFILSRSGIDVPFSREMFMILCGVIAVVSIGVAFWLRRNLTVGFLRSAAVFAIAFIISIAPWVLHNNYQYGFIVPRLLLDSPNTLVPSLEIVSAKGVVDYGQDIRVIPEDLKIDPNHAACKSTGSSEELDRYWGFAKSWKHYLTLPWRTVMNLDSAGYYVTTMPALLLFPLLLFIPAFWLKRDRWMRWMFLGTAVILLEWIFTANGVPWYGIGVFLGLAIAIEYLIARAPDIFTKSVAGTLVTLSLLICLGNRFWQFEMQRNMFEYPMGKVSAEVLEERTIAHYDDVADVVTSRHDTMPDRPYVYRVGTFIPYFIPRNLEVIGIADHQLDLFNCINQERDANLTLKRMKALGFNSVIFDTNTATIERDPNGSLHKKVEAFVNFLNTASGSQILLNDPEAGIAFVVLQ